MWTKADKEILFSALDGVTESLDTIVKQGEGILRLAEEVEELKRKIAKLEVE